MNEKPELLERNDVTVFKRDVNQNNTSISNSGNDNTVSDEVKYLDNSIDDEGKSTKIFYEQDNNDFQVDISDDFYEYNLEEENSTNKNSMTSTSGPFEDDSFLGALGSNSLKLTPEEVSSNAVMVEQMLEDHNKSK